MVIFSMYNALNRALSTICFGVLVFGALLAINQVSSIFIDQTFHCHIDDVKVFKFVKNKQEGWDEAQITFSMFGDFTGLYNWSIKYAYYWFELEYYDLDRNEIVIWDAFAVRNQTKLIGIQSEGEKWKYTARTKKHSLKGITVSAKFRMQVIPLIGFVYKRECLPTVLTFPDAYDYAWP